MSADAKLRETLRRQREELRRLNACLRLRKYEHFGRKTLAHYDELSRVAYLLRQIVDDKAWNAGFSHGMRMFRSAVASAVSPELLARLEYEIAWRVGEAQIDRAKGDEPWPTR